MSDQEWTRAYRIGVLVGCAATCFMIWLWFALSAKTDAAEPATFATWYSVDSCRREGTSGITASGEPLDDTALTCASWWYRLGTRLRVSCPDTGNSVVCRVNDRGPGKKARARGVVIDLTRTAFLKLAPLEKGRIRVKVEVVK